MWREERHAHLVVFDLVERRLAGMALLYIEPIDVLDSDRNCLIVRAINPMDDMLATHTASSIVDAFFDVAIEIANANDLAAVALPYHKGIHLMSNQRPIEKELEKRFMKGAVPYRALRGDTVVQTGIADWRKNPKSVSGAFHAYELQGSEVVSELYVLWANRLAPSAATYNYCLLYTSPSPRDRTRSRMPSSA